MGDYDLLELIRSARSLPIGLFGFGEKMGMEVIHDNLREQ
jgi:hypothetical protein